MNSDDTSVAVLRRKKGEYCRLLFHEKVTADNSAFRGIHPIVSLESHQESLALLVDKALQRLPTIENEAIDSFFTDRSGLQRIKPDFVSVTRGPGMRSSLTTGLDLAKGLAVAWQVPMLGVNHMQAHALTPRLVSMLDDPSAEPDPTFPFLSLLVSGGHTLLVHSKDIADHEIIATTTDIAIGDVIDKIARLVLPHNVLSAGGQAMYGRLLEQFAFPNGISDHNYQAPKARQEEIERRQSRWGWALVPPLAETRSGAKSKAMEFTFSGLGSAVERICKSKPEMTDEERVDLARESMRIAFEHLASRVGWSLSHFDRFKETGTGERVDTVVIGGGVASNEFLRTMYVFLNLQRLGLWLTDCAYFRSLKAFLAARGFPAVRLVSPPLALCSDNAAMIAWTGMEMYDRGWQSDLKCRALRRWSLDPKSDDGGILGVTGWVKRTAF